METVAAEELRERRAQFEVALASVADAVIAVDSSGRVTYINPAAELVTAWNSGMMVSRKMVPTKSFQSLENGLPFPGGASIAVKAN